MVQSAAAPSGGASKTCSKSDMSALPRMRALAARLGGNRGARAGRRQRGSVDGLGLRRVAALAVDREPPGLSGAAQGRELGIELQQAFGSIGHETALGADGQHLIERL